MKSDNHKHIRESRTNRLHSRSFECALVCGFIYLIAINIAQSPSCERRSSIDRRKSNFCERAQSPTGLLKRRRRRRAARCLFTRVPACASARLLCTRASERHERRLIVLTDCALVAATARSRAQREARERVATAVAAIAAIRRRPKTNMSDEELGQRSANLRLVVERAFHLAVNRKSCGA